MAQSKKQKPLPFKNIAAGVGLSPILFLEPISHTKKNIAPVPFRGPGIKDLDGTKKRFPTIAQCIPEKIRRRKPFPRPKDIVLHIDEVRSEHKMYLRRKIIVQPP